MYHPTRGGTRGGQAEFTWDQVKADEHRENYLGHSVFAPTGRWQNNKDVNWYNKDGSESVADREKRRLELMEVKMREEEEMNKRLGIKPGQATLGAPPSVGDVLLRGSIHTSSSRAGTGSNQAPLDASKSRWNTTAADKDSKPDGEGEAAGLTREDRRAARKLAKMQVREERRRRRVESGQGRTRRESSSEEDRRVNHQSGSYRRRDYDDHDGQRSRDRERSPSRQYDREGRRERDRRSRGAQYDVGEGRKERRDSLERSRAGDRHGRHDDRRLDSRHREVNHHERNQRDSHNRAQQARSPGRSDTPELQRRSRG